MFDWFLGRPIFIWTIVVFLAKPHTGRTASLKSLSNFFLVLFDFFLQTYVEELTRKSVKAWFPIDRVISPFDERFDPSLSWCSA
jgi:hypothetical protein